MAGEGESKILASEVECRGGESRAGEGDAIMRGGRWRGKDARLLTSGASTLTRLPFPNVKASKENAHYDMTHKDERARFRLQ